MPNNSLKNSTDLNENEKSTVESIYNLYSNASSKVRLSLLVAIMSTSCTAELSSLSFQVPNKLRFDFRRFLPEEIAFNTFAYLDARSLCRSAQVSKLWNKLANDDLVWKRMCEQHIAKKCHSCGIGLPNMSFLESLRLGERAVSSNTSPEPVKLQYQFEGDESERTAKRQKREHGPSSEELTSILDRDLNSVNSRKPSPSPPLQDPKDLVPYKKIFSERLLVEQNWRHGRYSLSTFEGNPGGVRCLQFDPRRALLMTGGYDKTIRVWNTSRFLNDTNPGATAAAASALVRVLYGHTGTVMALRFVGMTIITGSADTTLKVWDLKTGECKKTWEGHTGGVLCLHFDDKILVSGSEDQTVGVWYKTTGKHFTLRGHTDAVTAVQLVKSSRVFSCSGDATTRLWDVETQTCLRVFEGHNAPVQCLQFSSEPSCHGSVEPDNLVGTLITGSMDGTVKIWSVKTGECVNTLFGHVHGIWCLQFDTLRIVTGGYGGTVRMWDIDTGEQLFKIDGHSAAVNCCALTDSEVITADDDGKIKIWDFMPKKL
ncbi:hypothetical protein HK096_004173 [Nowakowskiella sp. JEL0078]|nr:hypothetical protein HK096_004173 [Nowakowskiella sp. JEL0078]